MKRGIFGRYTCMLEFAQRQTWNDDYSGQINESYKLISQKYAVEAMLADAATGICKCCFTTCTGFSWKLNRMHILGVDIDDEDGLNRAVSYCNNFHLRHISIESSKGHYWLFIDKIGLWDQIIKDASNVPGKDAQHHLLCLQRGRLFFRAFPKGEIGYPKMASPNRLPNRLLGFSEDFTKWYTSVYQWFHCEDFRNIERILVTQGKVFGLLPNPPVVEMKKTKGRTLIVEDDI